MDHFSDNNQVPMPAQSATPLDRLRYLLDLSHRSQAAFARQLDIDPGALSRVLSGKAPLTSVLINKAVVNLGVSKTWFESGDGVPFPRQTETAVTKGAPIYDIDVTAGCMPLSRMFADDRVVGYLAMPSINPSLPVVRVSGDSMTPSLPDGCLISIREIHDPSIILWGSIYVVELEDYRLVKYVRRHPSNPDMLLLRSDNPAYDDIEVPRASVLKMFLVENVIISKNFA